MINDVKKEKIRKLRENECFPIINRGLLWYDTLYPYQKRELSIWYKQWLDAPETGSCPGKPSWLK